MSWLNEGYKEPKTGGNYTKLNNGKDTGPGIKETSIRILTEPTMGFVLWDKRGEKPQPKRFPVNENLTLKQPIPKQYDECITQKDPLKFFWAMVVWNYDEKAIQILELTQKSIRDKILNLASNNKWGDPRNYDISILRITKGDKTSYDVVANPPIGEPSDEVLEKFAEHIIDMSKWMDGIDPFAKQ
jgi:hypothetical protein